MIIFLALVLIILMILIGGERGAVSLMTLAGNIVILFISILLMSIGFPALLLILAAGAGVCYNSLFYQNGNNPKTRAAFLATLLVMLLLFIPIYLIIWRSGSYDVLEMSGSRAVWKEVLAVYSVKTNTDQDNPQEVATMDDGKKQLLKDIFWEMNQISSRTESKTETVITETDDGHGNIVETESTVTQTYLYITVSHKTAEEMAAQYGFNEEQKGYLAELLADENNSL